jgi:hypothetical protein
MDNITGRDPKQDLREAHRIREFSAAVIVDLDDMLPVNCLVRDSSADGAQVRLSSSQTVADGSYLVNLKSRTAFQLRPVWRRSSLVGFKFEDTHVLDNSLPDHLEFLKSIFVEAKLRQTNYIVARGVCTRDQQRQLALGYGS